MSHRGRRRSAVPMLLTRRKPDYIAWPDFLDRCAPTLRPTKARRDDQRLPEWMRMPGGARTRLECDARAANPRRLRRLKQRINSHIAGEILGRSFAGTL